MKALVYLCNVWPMYPTKYFCLATRYIIPAKAADAGEDMFYDIRHSLKVSVCNYLSLRMPVRWILFEQSLLLNLEIGKKLPNQFLVGHKLKDVLLSVQNRGQTKQPV